MPMVLGLLIVLAFVYQVFFRYESWQSEDKPGVVYEHDSLTGETRMLKAGAKVDVFARMVGEDSGEPVKNGDFLQPLEEGMTGKLIEPDTEFSEVDLKDVKKVEKVARPVPVPREVVIASSAPPVPMANSAIGVGEAERPFAVRQIDLDKDGASEEIIQNASHPDGLLDISIVKNGREIYFGRGQQISLLPTRNRGWSDIALKMGEKTLQVFRYDVRSAGYKPIDEASR